MSQQAAWMEAAMIDVESASVPSQSKTMSPNRRASRLRMLWQRSRAFVSDPVDERREVRRQRRFEREPIAGEGMRERNLPRMQEHPFQACLGQRLVPCEIAVFRITGKRKPKMREMYADLMRAARAELGFEQCQRRVVLGPDAPAMEDRDCLLALVVDAHAALALFRRE